MPSEQNSLANIWPPQITRAIGSGFLLCGVLMSIVGSLAVTWRYQLDRDPRTVGLHFFAFEAALLLCGLLVKVVTERYSPKPICLASCLLASGALCSLAFVQPPAPVIFRILCVSLLGAAAGGLIASLLRFVRPYYQANAAYTISLCGSFFGAGCVLITAIFASAYWTYVAGWEAFLAVIPLVVLPFLTKISNTREHRQPGSPVHARLYKIVNELKSLPAILFSLLLFFQFGSEWTLAGWLPLLLIRRLGSSPEFGLFALTLYFAALLVGRLLAQAIRRKMPAVRLLIASVLVSILGYLLLSLTNSATGAALASVLTGLANAPIYGLVIEKIGRRFDAQPGFFNNIFSLAATGGMLMPCMIGFAAYYYGLQYVLIIPAFGAIAVLVLMSLVTLEAKLMAESTPATRDQPQQTMAAGAGRKP